MTTATIECPAKLNLTLQVKGRLLGGRHLLRSVTAPLSLADTLELSLSTSDHVEIEFADELKRHLHLAYSAADIAQFRRELCSERNLAWQAVERFRAAQRGRDCVRLRIIKRIPFQGGLGGGSADAAGALFAANSIFGAPFSKEQLIGIGADLGADVPVCLNGGLNFMFGTGELLLPIVSDINFSEVPVVIVKPAQGVSTESAYAGLNLSPELPDVLRTEDSPWLESGVQEVFSALRLSPLGEGPPLGSKSLEKLTIFEAVCKKPPLISASSPGLASELLVNYCRNSFSDSVFLSHPVVSGVAEVLRGFGSRRVLLCGSGSSLCGFFDSFAEAESAVRAIRLTHSEWFCVQSHLMQSHLMQSHLMQRHLM